MNENNNRTIIITLPDGYELADLERRPAQPGESYLWFGNSNEDRVVKHSGCGPTAANYWILRRISEITKPGICPWCGEQFTIFYNGNYVLYHSGTFSKSKSKRCPFGNVLSRSYATEAEAIAASNWERP